MSFIGSSELWGDDATARLCQILLEANDGMAQQISENRTDLLDLLTLKELERVDDCGLSLPYLAVHYDRPDMIRYLFKRGLDLSKPCDPMEFGTPMFYAVNLGRIHIVETLDSLGISVNNACDAYLKLTPSYYASRIGDTSVAIRIENLMTKELNACILFRKNYEKQRARKKFLKMRRAAIIIQKCVRGLSARIMVKLYRAGAISLDSMSVGSTGSGGSASSSKGGKSRATGKSSQSSASKSKQSKQKKKVGTTSSLDEGSLDSLSVESSIL